MAELPRISGAEAIRIFESLGYVQVRQRGSHVVLRKQDKGCVIPGKEIQDDEIEFVRVIEASQYTLLDYLLTKDLIDSPSMTNVLDEVMEMGGFWQRDLGGCLCILCPPEKVIEIKEKIDRMKS